MSNSRKDQDDWGDDSAALFRDARRAHDPTPSDRASFDRVLQNIEAASTLQPTAATFVGQASRGASVAKLSLVVLGVVAAGYLALGGARRESSVRAPVTTPDMIEHAAMPAPVPQPETAELQRESTVPPQREEPSIRSAPRRSRVSTARQRATKNETAIAAAPTAFDAQDEARSSVQEGASQAPQRNAPVEAAELRKPTRRESVAELEPGARQNAEHAEPTTKGIAPPASSTTEPKPSARQTAQLAEPTQDVAPPAPITELTLLKRMQAALRAADFTSALALCAEHAQRWPHGTFALEREGVHAIAACSLRTDDALPLAKRFLASHPHASMAMRVSSACRKQLQGH